MSFYDYDWYVNTEVYRLVLSLANQINSGIINLITISFPYKMIEDREIDRINKQKKKKEKKEVPHDDVVIESWKKPIKIKQNENINNRNTSKK